jgi:hypothetical protein
MRVFSFYVERMTVMDPMQIPGLVRESEPPALAPDRLFSSVTVGIIANGGCPGDRLYADSSRRPGWLPHVTSKG